MKKILVFLLPLMLIACPKEEITPEDEDSLMTEAEIGPSGGTLESEGISLTVPPGAFAETHTVQIEFETVHMDDFGDHTVSSVYRVTGIPSITSGTMTLRIAYDGKLEDEGELKSAHMLRHLSRIILATDGISSYEGIYFKYSYPFEMNRQIIVQLAEYMDQAMLACIDLKMITREGMESAIILYGKPTVVITGKDETGSSAYQVKMPLMSRLSKDEGVMSAPGRYSEYTNIKVNISRSALEAFPAKELKASCYMWVYRMLYFLYFGDYMDWFAYASAIYMKEKFAGVSDYVPAMFPIVGMSPFTGMEAGKDLYTWGAAGPSSIGGRILYHEKHHAMGMYPFIRYLDQQYPDDEELYMRTLREIILSESQKPIEGIIQAVEEPEYLWWPEFIDRYLTRQLSDIPEKQLLEKIDLNDEVHFIDETDTVKYFDRSYGDLSAKLCKVNLSPNLSAFVLEEGDMLNFKLGPKSLNLDYVTVLVYGYRNEELTLLKQGNDVTLENVKGLIDDGYTTLVAAVVNSASEPVKDDPETRTNDEEPLDIELTIKMVRERTWSWKYVTVDAVVTDALFRDSSGDETSWESFSFDLTDVLLEPSEDGSLFTASFTNQTSDYRYEVRIDITIDTETLQITDFYLFSKSESLSDNVVTLSEKYEISAKEGISIPVVYQDPDYLTHQVSGGNVCGVIDTYTYEYKMYPGETYEYSNTLVSYTCDAEADLVFFWTRQIEEWPEELLTKRCQCIFQPLHGFDQVLV